ncbi:MAG TPA: protein kinase [Terracidiphilus sp.]|nr:protein kinase [Terracidiphilus sp.]
MDQDRWKTVNDIFHAALEVSTSERGNFVANASGGDPSLAQEVNQLLLADLEAGSYIESPVAAANLLRSALATLAPSLNPGDVLCGRFRIVRAVGEGGMGHVFEAFDEELGVSVALKMIRPEIASNPEALARFRQEVRLARRITHPNVCRTFDIEHETRVTDQERGAKAEFVFLTMEYLAGETLAERISRDGRLPLDLAYDLARQVADALRAAQELGVVHRDIKPGNIMLVPASGSAEGVRAVITDFGLARGASVESLRSISGISNKGNPIGTLAYMAPEQLSGGPVSAATDVYAFGLVLFEMATGKRAFPSDTLLSGISQRLAGPPPDPCAQAPDLPDRWSRAIAGCLQTKPEERLPAAVDAIAILDGQRSGVPIRRRGLKSALRSWLTWRHAVAALLILCVAVSLFWAGLRFTGLKADAKVAPGALVYLPPVKNETGEKALDNITELIQAGLAQSTQVNLLDQGRVGDTLQRMTKPPDTVIDEPIAREIAMRDGAVRVVFATVTGSNGKYSLNVDVQQPDNTPTRYRDHWKKSFSWQSAPTNHSTTIPQELLVSVRNADDWIRKEVGESKNDIAQLNVPPGDVTTSSWEALTEFERGLNFHGQDKTQQAVQELQKAVTADPNFALAYARLGDLEVSLGRIADGLNSYGRALGLSEISRLDLRERDRIQGLAAADSGDFEASEKAFRDYTVNYDHDYLGWFYLSYPLIMLGRTEEGLSDLRKAYDMAPDDLSPAAQLSMFDAAAGNYSESRQLANRMRENGFGGYADYSTGLSSFLQGDYKQANHYFTNLSEDTSPPGQTRGTMMLAHLAAEEGRYSVANQLLSRGIDADQRAGELVEESAKLVDRASICGRLKDYSRMLDDLQVALSLDESPPRISSAAMIFGKAYPEAPSNVKEQIRSALDNLDNKYSGTDLGNYSRIAKLRLHASTLLARDKWESAVEVARRANVLDSQVGDESYLEYVLTKFADHERNPARKRALLEEAFEATAKSLKTAGYAWKDPYGNLPGFLSDEMTDYLKLGSTLESKDNEIETIEGRLRAIKSVSGEQGY